MRKHNIEEIGEGGNQSCPQGVGKVPDLGDHPVDGEAGCGLGCRPPALVEDGGQSRANLAQTFSVEYDRPIDGGGRRRRRARRRHRFLPFSLLRRSHGDGKREDSRLDWKQRLEHERRKNRGRPSSEKRKDYVQPRVRLAGRKIRRRGEARPPTSNQPPRGARGRGLLGPAALRTCPFASLLSQVRARLGPGGYCRRSGNGGTQICLPAACGVA